MAVGKPRPGDLERLGDHRIVGRPGQDAVRPGNRPGVHLGVHLGVYLGVYLGEADGAERMAIKVLTGGGTP
ncbi:hypothetical protein [Nonomuraea glycinis]|uniref:hypothetical protein n=1 Tax=Nonomuraea glycinis TaxID=2047744 RepID=UPI002E0DC981|nr:hypothetical protein OHA68_39830 [Nonomuraea glycinis]